MVRERRTIWLVLYLHSIIFEFPISPSSIRLPTILLQFHMLDPCTLLLIFFVVKYLLLLAVGKLTSSLDCDKIFFSTHYIFRDRLTRQTIGRGKVKHMRGCTFWSKKPIHLLLIQPKETKLISGIGDWSSICSAFKMSN